jgi:DNA-binding transcriptional LysR family regulator
LSAVQPRFTPRQLEAYVAAAEIGGFTQAAHRLHLTPSAVSNLIGELEAALGFALFERSTRKVALTSAGRDFLPSAMAVLRQIRLAEAAAGDVRDRSTDVVRAAAPMVVAAAVLPPLIAAFRETRPRITVRILDTGVEWLGDRVAMGEADLALGPDRAVGEAVSAEPLFPTPWVLWCSPAHPLASKKVLAWRDLEGVEVCAAGHDHEHSVAPMLAELPEAERLTPTVLVDNLSTALGLAAANLVVTLSPDYAAVMARPLGLVMRRVVEPEVIRSMTLYTPTRRAPSPAAQAFAAFLRTQLTQ